MARAPRDTESADFRV